MTLSKKLGLRVCGVRHAKGMMLSWAALRERGGRGVDEGVRWETECSVTLTPGMKNKFKKRQTVGFSGG